MRFIQADGTMGEGQPLSDQRAALRDNLNAFLICYSAFHGTYGPFGCRDAANYLSVKFDPTATSNLNGFLIGEIEELRNPKAPSKAEFKKIIPEPRAVRPDDPGF